MCFLCTTLHKKWTLFSHAKHPDKKLCFVIRLPDVFSTANPCETFAVIDESLWKAKHITHILTDHGWICNFTTVNLHMVYSDCRVSISHRCSVLFQRSSCYDTSTRVSKQCTQSYTRSVVTSLVFLAGSWNADLFRYELVRSKNFCWSGGALCVRVDPDSSYEI